MTAERFAGSFPRVTISAVEIPAAELVADIAAMSGVSVVVPATLTEEVTIELNQVEADRALSLVAQQLGLHLVRSDGAFYLAKNPAGPDRVAVVYPGYERSGEVLDAFRRLVGSRATVEVVGDRLMIAGDRDSVADAERLLAVLGTGPDTWLIEVQIVEMSDDFAELVGLDYRAGGVLSMRGSSSAGDLVAALSGIRADLVMDVIAEASRSKTGARVVSSATVRLVEGRRTRITQGEAVPIPQRTVSDSGTVTTTGYQFVDTGFILEIFGRRVPNGLFVEVTPTLGTVSRFVEEAPVIARSTISASAIIASGEVVILSGFERLSDRQSNQLRPLGLRNVTSTESKLYLILRATRVRVAPPLAE